MPVRTRRVYEPPSHDDGYRVLVDGVWPRGISRERAALDHWAPELARGLILLVVFTASALTIVALAVLVGAIGRWWVLISVMAVDFAVTAAVLVTDV